MSKSKKFTMGAAVVAAAFAGTVALAGSASAGGPSTATFSCKDNLGTSYGTAIPATFSTGSGQLSIQVDINPGVAIDWDTLTTTANFNGPSGVVSYSGTVNDAWSPPGGSGNPVFLGPLPKVSGTISAGQALTTIKSTAAPSPTNWSIKMVPPAGTPVTGIYCVTNSDLSPALTYN